VGARKGGALLSAVWDPTKGGTPLSGMWGLAQDGSLKYEPLRAWLGCCTRLLGAGARSGEREREREREQEREAHIFKNLRERERFESVFYIIHKKYIF
jgi:hypothetical protein